MQRKHRYKIRGKVHTARVHHSTTSLLKVSSGVELVLKMNGDCGNENQDSAYTNFLKQKPELLEDLQTLSFSENTLR